MENTVNTLVEQGNPASPKEVATSPEGCNVSLQKAGSDSSSRKLKRRLLATLELCRVVTNDQVSQHVGKDAEAQAVESPVTDDATSPSGRKWPKEVLRSIFTCAMISDYQPINEGDPSPASPSIAVGALFVNHEVYHISRRALYEQNKFVFTSTGYLFDCVVRPLGLFVCKIGCGPRLMPAFSNVTLDFGSDYHDGHGITDVKTWTVALAKIYGRVEVKELTLHFRHFCWNNSVTLERIAALIGAKFQVSRQLTIFGTDYHWEMDMGTFPRNLGMNASPFRRELYPRVLSTFPQQPGTFECSYQPAESDFELFGLKEDGSGWMDIDDAGRLYREWCEDNGIEIR